MTKVLVLYYSSYGHIQKMAQAVAEGASIDGVTVDIKRVPETVPDEVVKASGFQTDQTPIAEVEDLANYDAVIFGVPTRYGRMPSQMAAFMDQTGGLWKRGALNGKIGGAFVSTGAQHGGQEMTLQSMITNMMHLGFVIVGLPYSYQEQLNVDEIIGGSPYGATTVAGPTGQRQPTEIDLGGARHQGALIAELAKKVSG